MSEQTRRFTEAVTRAHSSIKGARAKLDSIMDDVRSLPAAYKTNVCHIIEHAFDELRAAEHELAAATLLGADADGDDDGEPRRAGASLERP